jgi:hypothetical protein
MNGFIFVFFSNFFFSRSPPTSGGWLFSKNISAGNEKKPPLQGCANPTKKILHRDDIDVSKNKKNKKIV